MRMPGPPSSPTGSPDAARVVGSERSRSIEVEGLRLHVSERGRGRGRPLVLIMGLGGTHKLWDPLRDALGDDVPTIAFDNPGVGLSSTPRTPLRLRALARIVLGLLDELGHAEVDVLGLSFGGAMAQEMARRAPHRIGRLILAATTPGLGGVPGTRRAAAILATPRRYYDREYLYRVSPDLYGGKLRREPGLMAQQADARIRQPPSVRGYYLQLAAIYGWSSLPWLHRIAVPTLVLGGDDDPVTPVGNARILAGCIPGAQLRVLRGGGHLFVIDSVDEVLPWINSFLRTGRAVAGAGGDDATRPRG